jgi:glycerophosphoryl diester phosphodiesterase
MQVIAHRGASAYAPEHSFEAYDLALAVGASAIELDLRVAPDGELLVHHDPLRGGGEQALVLDEVLARYGRATRYWIELKDPGAAAERRMVDAIGRRRLGERVVIQAFDRASLHRIGRLDRTLPRVALLRAGLGAQRVRRRTAWAGRTIGIGPEAACVSERVLEAARVRALGVYPYTVNDAAEMERLAALGVDGIFTDRPDLLRAIADLSAGSRRTSRSSGSRRPGRAAV